jgi:hypothetical protein
VTRVTDFIPNSSKALNPPVAGCTVMTVGKATVQSHGYNALRFRELAKQIGIKSASLH